MEKKYFFGWTNIKWVIRELANIYSDKPSVFSKKRIESGISFISAVGLIIGHSYHTWATITTSEIISEAVILFSISGYQLNAIQKEKLTSTTSDKKNEPTSIVDVDPLKKSEDLI